MIIRMLLTAIKGLVTQELLLSIFKDVILKYLVSELDEYVANSETKSDDKLLQDFKDWLSKR